MHRVAVGGDLGEKRYIAVGDFLEQKAAHADLDILDADGAARLIVEHGREFRCHVAVQHNRRGRAMQSGKKF